MAVPKTDETLPAGRDPAEGGRETNGGSPAVNAPEESHLGPAGDPAEGDDTAGEG